MRLSTKSKRQVNITIMSTQLQVTNKPLPKSKTALQKRSAAPQHARDFPKAPAYYLAVKNVYARKGALTVRLHKDGYFRRHDNLPKVHCTPLGPSRVTVSDKNEMRRGLYVKPVAD